MKGAALDTGALIALERGDPRMTALLARVAGIPGAVVTIPAGVVGHAWRDGQRQARLARLLGAPDTASAGQGGAVVVEIGRET